MLKLKMKEVEMKTIEEINQLRDDLLISKKLFKDDSFCLKAPMKNIKWLRPHKICKNPKLIVDGISRFDVNQGSLGDCWFMAAIASLAEHEQLFNQVVCETNSDFGDDTYCGLFQFRFWHYGSWVNIIIDDRLPTTNGKLVFARSKSLNEFWPALLEKAYAKLHGGYKILNKGGLSTEAFSNLTGGVTEVYYLKNPPENFYKMMHKAFKRNTLMVAGVGMIHRRVGLLNKHAYTVSDIAKVIDKYRRVHRLIRIRNPFGDFHEFTGDWSDSSKKWNKISASEKQKINFKVEKDGEFWITYKDFMHYFETLQICNLTPDLLIHEPCNNREWKVTSFHGVCQKNKKINYIFEVNDQDPDSNDIEDYCTIVVAIMNIPKNKNDANSLGLKITPINGKGILKSDKPYYCSHENTFRYNVMPGHYKFKVFSYYKKNDFQYLIRIFYETKKTDIVNSVIRFPPVRKKLSKNDTLRVADDETETEIKNSMEFSVLVSVAIRDSIEKTIICFFLV